MASPVWVFGHITRLINIYKLNFSSISKFTCTICPCIRFLLRCACFCRKCKFRSVNISNHQCSFCSMNEWAWSIGWVKFLYVLTGFYIHQLFIVPDVPVLFPYFPSSGALGLVHSLFGRPMMPHRLIILPASDLDFTLMSCTLHLPWFENKK